MDSKKSKRDAQSKAFSLFNFSILFSSPSFVGRCTNYQGGRRLHNITRSNTPSRAIFDAVCAEDLFFLRHLLKVGVNPDYFREKGYMQSPFLQAAYNGNREILQDLIRAGAHRYREGKDCNVALREAARHGHHGIVCSLIELGLSEWMYRAALDKSNKQGDTALTLAARRGHSQIVQTLIEANANINKCDGRGNTPILLAVKYSQNEVVRELAAAGASLEFTLFFDDEEPYHTTILHWAARRGLSTVLFELIDFQPSLLNSQTSKGRTALHESAVYGFAEVAQVLVEAGADLDVKDNTGLTALVLAQDNGNEKVAQVLLEAGATYVEGILHNNSFWRDTTDYESSVDIEWDNINNIEAEDSDEEDYSSGDEFESL